MISIRDQIHRTQRALGWRDPYLSAAHYRPSRFLVETNARLEQLDQPLPMLSGPIVLYDHGRKKLDYYYETALRQVARAAGADVIRTRRLADVLSSQAPSAILYEFGEEHALQHGYYPRILHGLDRIQSRHPEAMIVNSPLTGQIVADKIKTNQALSPFVAMPAMQTEAKPGGLLFVNEARGTQQQTKVAKEITPRSDAAKYATEFIDTTHSFEGATYYVSLRLMCVGADIVSTLIRARDTREGSVTVHAKNTPLDPALLAHLSECIVVPNKSKLADLAKGVHDVLGPGLYAHDLLPQAGSDQFVLSETGFKPFGKVYANHLQPIADRLPDGIARIYDGRFYFDSALAFVRMVGDASA